jgi:hypothetical protein
VISSFFNFLTAAKYYLLRAMVMIPSGQKAREGQNSSWAAPKEHNNAESYLLRATRCSTEPLGAALTRNR